MARLPRLPPIHALAAFESAARLGGFAQAAAELCITPSAVSHRIRQLESQVGDQLFERSASGVRLTDAGRRYLLGVREAFDRLARLSPLQADVPPRLRVGAPPTFARNLLIPRLPAFYRQWPEVEIEVAVAAPMQERHERHDVDIRFGRPPFDERASTPLFEDRLLALAAPGYTLQHALAAPADLARAELLRSPLLRWSPWFAAAELDWPEPVRGALFTDLGVLLEAAAGGLGVALCTRRVAARWTDEALLEPLFGVAPPSPSTYHLLVDPQAARRPEVAAFVDWLTASLNG